MAEHSPSDPAEREDDVFAVQVRVTPQEAAELIRSEEYDYGDRPHVTEERDGTGLLDLFVSRRQIEELESRGLDIRVLSNQSARARERLSEVGEGDRFRGGEVAPSGLGRKTGENRPQRGDEEAS